MSKKLLLLIAVVSMIFVVLAYSVWFILTPRWAFSITTDKSTYLLGEDVTITVRLQNLGYITHSFTTCVSEPVIVSVEYQPTVNPTVTFQVWYNPFHRNITEFTLGPNDSLERTFTWNQTNTQNPWSWNQTYMPGTYHIKAFIPKADEEIISGWDRNLFDAYTTINVTSTPG